MLGYQNQVRLSGDARPQREMPGVPSHHLDDLYPTMRSGGCARTLDDLGDVSQSRVETERVVRAREIFVDGLRHADDAHASVSQRCRDPERVFTAANNERLEFQPLDVVEHFLRAIEHLALLAQLLERIGARGAEVRAAVSIPPPHQLAIEWQHFRRRIDQTAPTVEKTGNL